MKQTDQVPKTNIEKSLVLKDKGKEASTGADTSGTKEHRILIEDLNVTPPIEVEDEESDKDEGPTSKAVVKQEDVQDECVLKNCARVKEQVVAKRKAPMESRAGESSTMEPMRNPPPVVPESTDLEARKHENLSAAAYGVQRQHDGPSTAYRQHLRTSSPSSLWPRPAVARPVMIGHQPSGMGILGPTPTSFRLNLGRPPQSYYMPPHILIPVTSPGNRSGTTPSGFRLNMGPPPQPNYMLPHTLPGTLPGNRSGPTPTGFRLNLVGPPQPNYMLPHTLPGTSPSNRSGPTYSLGQVSSVNPPFLGAFRLRESHIENRATPSGAGPSGLTMEQPRVEWSEDELDHLWIGVRRHGLGNWDAMLRDPHLKFSMSKTADDLDSRWSLQEAVKTIPMPPWPLMEQRILHLSEPTSSNPPVTGATQGSVDPAKFVGDNRNSQGGL